MEHLNRLTLDLNSKSTTEVKLWKSTLQFQTTGIAREAIWNKI